MMIECPRCGFAQPKDQYCASCGVNIDQLLAKPRPFTQRLLQNPNFHLSLIGGLIVIVIAWIISTQSALVKREVGELLDLPVSSQNAATEGDAAGTAANIGDSADAAATTGGPDAGGGAGGGGGTERSSADAVAFAGAPPGAAPANANADAAGGGTASATAAKSGAAAENLPRNLELSHWEIPREQLATLVTANGVQRVGESNGGRTYYWPTGGSRVFETIQSAGQPLPTNKSAPFQSGGQLTTETPPTSPEMFQFMLTVQLTRTDGRDASVRWNGNFVLPSLESAAAEVTPPPPAPGAPPVPVMRSVTEAGLGGSSNLKADGLLVIVADPPNRSPRDEFVSRAGTDGPWVVFQSPEFRSGLTDWIMIVQLK